jgi:F-type H+-transporting ATPase subunit a
MFLAPLDQFHLYLICFIQRLQEVFLGTYSDYLLYYVPGIFDFMWEVCSIYTFKVVYLFTFVAFMPLQFSLMSLFTTTLVNSHNSGSKFLNSSTYVYNMLNSLVKNIVKDNVGIGGLRFSSLLGGIFYSIILCNCLGLIPYTATLTAQLAFTLALASYVFVFLNLLSIFLIRHRLVALFIPSGSPVVLLPLLISVEAISYIVRVVSLSIRLFANIMSGHTLIKILGGFSWLLITSGSLYAIASGLVVYIVMSIIMLLEVLISFVQAYVFLVLVCVYLNDVLSVSMLKSS